MVARRTLTARRWDVSAAAADAVVAAVDANGNLDYKAAELITQDTVSTTDATPTTISTLATTNDKGYLLTTRAVGRNTTDSSQVVSFERAVNIRNDGGVVTVGTATSVHADNSQMAGADLTITNSGTDIQVQVTGAAATNVDWLGRSILMEV